MKYVDTDVFLHWATDNAEHGKRATQILRHIEVNEKAITSSLSLWLFDRVMQGTEGYAMPLFLDQVSRLRNLKVVSLEAEHLRDAADARNRFKIPPEVAVAYAVARERSADAVYSTNSAYDRTDLKREF